MQSRLDRLEQTQHRCWINSWLKDILSKWSIWKPNAGHYIERPALYQLIHSDILAWLIITGNRTDITPTDYTTHSDRQQQLTSSCLSMVTAIRVPVSFLIVYGAWTIPALVEGCTSRYASPNALPRDLNISKPACKTWYLVARDHDRVAWVKWIHACLVTSKSHIYQELSSQ